MEIDKSYELPFSTDVLFGAWVSSDTVIAPATRMEIDPFVGGYIRLFIETPESTSVCKGTFMEINPRSNVRYSWEWNGDGKETEVAVDFSSSAGGSTVRIRHSGFRDQQTMQMHATGWDSYIDGLKEFLKRRIIR